MIRAFFRGKPSTQKPKSWVSAAPDKLKLEEVLSVLKLLTQSSARSSQASEPIVHSEEAPNAATGKLNASWVGASLTDDRTFAGGSSNPCLPWEKPQPAGSDSGSQPAQPPQWILDVLHQQRFSPSPCSLEPLRAAASNKLNLTSGTAADSPHSSSGPGAIIPTSIEKEALDIYAQFLIQNSTSVNRRRHQRLRHLDKVLFISACIYLVGASGWLFNQGLTRSITSDRPIVQAEQLREKSQADRGVDKEEEASPQAELLPPSAEPTQTSQLETESPPQTSIPVPSVRQLPELEIASVPAPVLAPPPPKPVSLPTATPPKAPAPKLTQAPTSIPSPPAPEAPSPTATDSSPTAPSQPPEAPSPSTAQSPPVLSSKAAVPPLINSRLVGILQLGDRSVALFDLNDVTQRVKVGDRIGSSGWTLGAVTDQTAEIYRAQEKRSLYVGEGF